MEAAPAISPSSEDRFWGRLRDRVEIVLEDRNLKAECGKELERSKRLHEDPLLLIRGFDSIASSLSQLTDTLSAAHQGVRDIAKPSPTKILQKGRDRTQYDDIQPKSKRHCSFNADKHYGSPSHKDDCTISDKLGDGNGSKEDKKIAVELKNENMKKAKNLAVSMASKANYLARELGTIKSQLRFMQERCTLLEEENRRYREGIEEGVRPEEDDLVRLQLEALLTEKSRLANENATLTRENQCLLQLVEYHQLTSQDLRSSYDESIHGLRLDFSSPLGTIHSESDEDDECYLTEVQSSPSPGQLEIPSSLNEHIEEQQQ